MVERLDGEKLAELLTTVSNMKDVAQINSITEAIKTAQQRRRREMSSLFNLEDQVWLVQKTKRSRGVIKKINISRAKVFMEDGYHAGKTVSVSFRILELRAE